MFAFTSAGAFSNTQQKKKKTKSTHWCEGDAAALHARHLRVRQTVISTKRRREVAIAEFFDLRLLQSRHQSSAAFGGGDVRFLGMLSPNQAKNSGQKKISSNNSTPGKLGTHAAYSNLPTRKNRGCTRQVVASGCVSEISISYVCNIPFMSSGFKWCLFSLCIVVQLFLFQYLFFALFFLSFGFHQLFFIISLSQFVSAVCFIKLLQQVASAICFSNFVFVFLVLNSVCMLSHLLRPSGSQKQLYKLENVGWSVSRPTVTRVAFDLPESEEPSKTRKDKFKNSRKQIQRNAMIKVPK